ncbi:MAG: Tim44 domain-containing protein, partial [Desulforhopalus sp.]
MTQLWKRFTPLFLLLLTITFAEGGLTTDYADAASKMGGKSFSTKPSKVSPGKAPGSSPAASPATGGFGRGLMGGLLGGAIGGMLFGSMFGGSGVGILPLLLLGGAAFFLYRRFTGARQA